MDIRAHGKDFDQYYERARAKENIHYIKSIPSRIVQVPGSKDLRVRYLDENSKVRGAGLRPGRAVRGHGTDPQMAESWPQPGHQAQRIRLLRHRPAVTRCPPPGPVCSSAAAFQEPKDIPETVTQASGAASMAMELLAPARNTLITKKSYPHGA